MPAYPFYLKLLFISITWETLRLFYRMLSGSQNEKISKNALLISGGLLTWLVIQTILAKLQVYSSNLQAVPPNIVLFGVLPTVILMVVLFLTPGGRTFMDSLPLQNLTWLHVIRIPVEIGLYFLAVEKAVPELMTFAGRNFDILAGISAPLIAYYGVQKGRWSPKVVLVWNIIALGLLLNIVILAVLAAPTPLQRFAFDQPNVAVLYFPVSWLPTFIVPAVLFSHLVAIRRLWGAVRGQG